jgi:hypothetical protein
MNETVDRVRPGVANTPMPKPAAPGVASALRMDATTVLRVQASVLSQSGFRAAATAFANELTSLFGATRVCLGWVEPTGVSIEAMSGEVDFLRDAELCRTLAAAMDEALGQGASIVYPPAPGARPRITLAHAELARRGAAAMLTIPLVSATRLMGAVTLELRGSEMAPARLVGPCEQLACMLAPVLELKRDLDRPWQQQLWRSVCQLRERALGPGHVALKAGLLALLPLVAALSYWPADYRVSAPAHLEGSIQRILVAPSDGFCATRTSSLAMRLLPGRSWRNWRIKTWNWSVASGSVSARSSKTPISRRWPRVNAPSTP